MNINEQLKISNNTETISKNGFSRNLAFIIGINNYKNGISSLKTAVNDAKKLVETLREKHGYQVWVCLDEVATLSKLNQLLEKTLLEQVTENDRLLFYFAGHGVALNGDDGPAGYLIPQDAKQGDTDSYLPMTKLHDALSKLPCRHFLGIFDCCFSGAFRWSSTRDLLTTPEVIHKERYDRFITDPAWQIITSSASDQKALDNFKLDTERGQVGSHSPFAAALLEALEGAADIYPPAKNNKPAGDGVITATELYLYLRDRVEIPTEKCNLRQTPGIWCLNKHDKGEYIFLSPGHELNLPPAPPLDESKNPYRGLEAFEEKHSEFFFGRSELVEKLQAFVQIHPLTVVLGASGSGKSSLVKAGLIPKLKKETTDKWRILSPIRPGETPFQSLNNALVDAKLPKVELQNKQKTLSESVDVWAKNNPNCNLLIFIDQSEELITLCKNDNERKEFFQQILAAINAHRDKLRVVLTLRSDFEPQVRDAGLKFMPEVMNKLGQTELKNRWQNGRFIVPAMTRAELREAIEKPAEARVMYFQPHELVEKLIDEVADMPGALPLLSFALSELFLKYLRKQRNAQFNQGKTIERAITKADYEELGGVMRSLTQRADEEYLALVKTNSAYEQVIRHVMLRMVALTGGELARRRVPLSELEYPEEKNILVKQTIERFSKARLLVEGQDAEGNPYVEPAHDALIRGWEKLRDWLQEEKNLELQRRLTPRAFDWNKQQQPRLLGNADPYLDVLNKEVLNSTDNNWLNKVEAEFVRLSVNRRKRNSRMRWGIAASVIVGLSGLTIWALRNLRNAQIQEISSLRQASEANWQTDNQLDALVQSLRAGKNLKQSQLLQLFPPDSQQRKEVVQTLRKVAYSAKESNRLQLPLGEYVNQKMFFGSNGKILMATVENPGIVSLWNLTGKREKVGEFPGHKGAINHAVISADGNKLVTVDDHLIRLWDIETQKYRRFPRKIDSSKVRELSFNSNGKQIGIVTHNDYPNNNVFLWDWTKQNRVYTFRKSQTEETPVGIGFNNDGRILVATANDKEEYQYKGNIFDWTAKKKPISKDLKEIGILGAGSIDNVIFSPDGKQLLRTSSYVDCDAVKLYNFSENQDGRELEEGCTVNFSHDSSKIVIGNSNGSIYLYEKNNDNYFETTIDELKVHESFVSNLIFSPDDSQLISVGNSINLFNLEPKNLDNFKFSCPESKPQSTGINQNYSQFMGFNSDGKKIIVDQRDGNIFLCDSSGKYKLLKTNFQNNISSVVVSSDNKKIAIARKDNKIEKWDLSSGKRDEPFKFTKGNFHSMIFNPENGNLSVTTQGKDKTYVWEDVSLGNPPRELNGKSMGLSFGSDGELILNYIREGEAEGNVRFVSLDMNKQQQLTFFDTSTSHKITISPDTSLMAVFAEKHNKLTDTGTIELRDFRSKQLLAEFKTDQTDIKRIHFTSDSSSIMTVAEDGTAKVWQIGDLDYLLSKGCDWAHDYLQNNPNVSESDRNLCN
ncbi:MAG: caspase family protein [Rivularia sp. (in: cyanobacteria)]